MPPLDKNFLLINKPAGWTSLDAVNYIRNRLPAVISTEPQGRVEKSLSTERDSSTPLRSARNDKPKRPKVGHAGTLDPFATGLLIVGVGREATKRLDEFKGLAKTYVATIKLGSTSTTGDSTGEIQEIKKTKNQEISKSDVENVLKTFLGKQLQIPPMHSAKQVGGKRLYKLARQGIEIEREPNQIEIFEIRLLDFKYPDLKIEVRCGAGTYIRTLAEDIGETLGTGAYCAELMRTRIGECKLEDAVAPDAIDAKVFKS